MAVRAPPYNCLQLHGCSVGTPVPPANPLTMAVSNCISHGAKLKNLYRKLILRKINKDCLPQTLLSYQKSSVHFDGEQNCELGPGKVKEQRCVCGTSGPHNAAHLGAMATHEALGPTESRRGLRSGMSHHEDQQGKDKSHD